MAQGTCPVEVISVCNAEGEIRPLRLRFQDENRQTLRLNVDEIVSVREITHVGAEAQVYICRARVWDQVWVFELKYSIRRHSWSIRRQN